MQSAAAILATTSGTDADVEALRNDLSEARELAAEYQRQLAGKSNESATLRIVLEKSFSDIALLESANAELQERCESFRAESAQAEALANRLREAHSENEQLRRHLAAMHDALENAQETIRDLEGQIASGPKRASGSAGSGRTADRDGHETRDREFLRIGFEDPDQPLDVSFSA